MDEHEIHKLPATITTNPEILVSKPLQDMLFQHPGRLPLLKVKKELSALLARLKEFSKKGLAMEKPLKSLYDTATKVSATLKVQLGFDWSLDQILKMDPSTSGEDVSNLATRITTTMHHKGIELPDFLLTLLKDKGQIRATRDDLLHHRGGLPALPTLGPGPEAREKGKGPGLPPGQAGPLSIMSPIRGQ